MWYYRLIIILIAGWASIASSQTEALWLFDEPVDLYPGCVLSESGDNNYVLILGSYGRISSGKYGNALEPGRNRVEENYPAGTVSVGLQDVPKQSGRMVDPLLWKNARFCGLITNGENHLRKEIDFIRVTDTGLNLGDFDWTVEFWYQPLAGRGIGGVVFEIGSGPRGENRL